MLATLDWKGQGWVKLCAGGRSSGGRLFEHGCPGNGDYFLWLKMFAIKPPVLMMSSIIFFKRSMIKRYFLRREYHLDLDIVKPLR